MIEIIPKLKAARRKFIDEKLQYYIDDPSRRAVDDNGDCFYRFLGGRKKCILGSCISDTIYSQELEGYTVSETVVQEKLPKEVLDLGINFLREMQGFHDRNDFWTDTGLSERGVEQLETIKRYYL